MNMNEINDLFVDFDEMGFCPTTLVKNPEAYAIQWRINMREAIIKHEQDTLKEFVEWLKDICSKHKAKYAEFEALPFKEGHTYEYGACAGKQKAIQNIIDELDQDLENFIKEREK